MAVMARESWTDGRLDEFKESVNRRFDEVDKRFDEVDKRFDEVDKRFDEVDRRFGEVDRRFGEVDRRFDEVDRRLDRMDGDIKELRQTMVHGFFVLVGVQATSTLTLVGLMVGLKVF